MLAMRTAIKWLQNVSAGCEYEYILSIDFDDPDHDSYMNWFFQAQTELDILNSPNRDFKLYRDLNKNVVQAVNGATVLCIGDIIISISDDFESFPNWDIAIMKALRNKSGVLKTFDGTQKWIVTLPIMTRDYYKEQGYLYYPQYDHMFCDTDQTHKADLQKKLIFRNDIVFKHNHYSVKGQPKDAVNIKADSTWDSGERTYLKRCKEKFGLGNVDIFNLSKEAHQAGHVNWLKKKLR